MDCKTNLGKDYSVDGITVRFTRRRYSNRTFTWISALLDGIWTELGDPWPSIRVSDNEIRMAIARIKKYPACGYVEQDGERWHCVRPIGHRQDADTLRHSFGINSANRIRAVDIKSQEGKMIVKKGKYYLGDPCYCFSSEKWDKVLDSSNHFDRPYQEGRKTLVAFHTAYGDGTYEDQNSFEYDVDSGLIGLIPVSMADNADHGLREITLENDTECFEQGGVLHFGNISIDTN